MGRGIVLRFHRVAGLRQHSAVWAQHYGADRYLAPRAGGTGLGQGELHGWDHARVSVGGGQSRGFAPRPHHEALPPGPPPRAVALGTIDLGGAVRRADTDVERSRSALLT